MLKEKIVEALKGEESFTNFIMKLDIFSKQSLIALDN